MISCEEAAKICNKAQYNEAPLLEKLRLKLHILFCNTCSKFSKKNTQLTSLCDKADLRCLSESEKVEMKEKIKPEL
ncbi:hypothetical protein GGR42_003276 [Saonia flava]|uniref:Glycine dehydrogenase n=1 Tax=Saonia flava TaxID=523696 RepID=A0A846R493_9FLAO|nr:hypothetical protein [Saonia flava]